MLFHTPIFFLFFSIFFPLYWLARKRLRLQNTIILVGSYIFYGAWDYRFLVLIIISTVTDYLAAIGASGTKINAKSLAKAILYLLITCTGLLSFNIEENYNFILLTIVYSALLFSITFALNKSRVDNKKIFVTLSIVVNLGLLAVFKYFNFFAENLMILAESTGVSLNHTTLNIVLPVGISFYTFQTMSYTLDVYKKKVQPSKSLLDTSAFVAFFPQLVAGPIERGASLLPQFLEKRIVTTQLIKSGCYLFLTGLFKKAVIADNLALIADPVFSNPQSHSSGALLVALLAFTFQIYCDFSGYSDMARGIARTMGFNLMVNFKIPYISLSPSEFWRRWHISLSSWLRDYLYISLGGNRNGELKTLRNLMITMLLGGLWHGASWTFIAWGLAHGLILVIYRYFNFDETIKTINRDNRVIASSKILLSGFFFFTYVVFTWLLFRANDFSTVSEFLSGIFSFNNMSGDWHKLLILITPLWIHDIMQVRAKDENVILNQHVFIRINIVLTILCCYFFLTPSEEISFIYFDF